MDYYLLTSILFIVFLLGLGLLFCVNKNNKLSKDREELIVKISGLEKDKDQIEKDKIQSEQNFTNIKNELENKSIKLEIELNNKREFLVKIDLEYRQLQTNHRMLNEQYSSINCKLASVEAQKDSLEIAMDAQKYSFEAAMEAQKESLETAIKTQKNNLETAIEAQKHTADNNLKLINDSLLAQFKNIAHNAMNENREKFTEESKRKIDTILSPLQEKIQEFQRQMQDGFNIDIKEKFSLKESINSIVTSNETIRKEAHKLTNALKGNRIMLGHWGEIVLENILNSSGLRKDLDYFAQSSITNNDDSSAKLKPDILIKLPDDKYLIIDAKISFFDSTAYEELTDNEAKGQLVKQFMQKIKAHIDNLASKEYHTSLGLNTPEMTLMFIPIESWYNVIIKHHPELYNFAWNKNIALISPSTLFVVLKTVSYIWKGKMQTENSMEIANMGGKLYDSFVDFTDNLLDIGRSIEKSSSLYDKAMHRLQHSRVSLLSRAEKMKNLGINSNKTIDASLRVEEEDVILEQ